MTPFGIINYMSEIRPYEVYTTHEVESLLKISTSTIKRLLKRGIINANKVGGQYRVLGKEILRLVSPTTEREMVHLYQKLKKKTKSKLKTW